MRVPICLLLCAFLALPARGNPFDQDVSRYVDATLTHFNQDYPDAGKQLQRGAWYFGGRQLDRHYSPGSPNGGPLQIESTGKLLKRAVIAFVIFLPLFYVFNSTENVETRLISFTGLFLLESLLFIYPGFRRYAEYFSRANVIHLRRIKSVLKQERRRPEFKQFSAPELNYVPTLARVVEIEAKRSKDALDEMFARVGREGLGWEGVAVIDELFPHYVRLWTLAGILKSEGVRTGAEYDSYEPFLRQIAGWVEDCRFQVLTFIRR